MANNYTPSYNQYLTQTAGYALPSSVRSYSVFDPSSNSWRRMTNDGRSPLPMTPAQEQAAVAGALMQAQQTQGKVWNPLPAPAQTPAQTPLGAPRMASNRQLGGGMGVPASQPSASPRGVSVNPAEAVAFGVAMQNPNGSTTNLNIVPNLYKPLSNEYSGQEIPLAEAYNRIREISPKAAESPKIPEWIQAGRVDDPLLDPNFAKKATNYSLNTTAKNIMDSKRNLENFLDLVLAAGAFKTVRGALPNAFQPSGFGRKALPNGSSAMPMGGPEGPSGSSHWTWRRTPNSRRTYSKDTINAQRPVDAEWVEVIPTGPAPINGMPSRLALPTPTANPSAGFGPIRTQANIPSGMPIRLGGHLELPPAGVGVQPMGRTPSIIRSPMEMTSPSGLARWQYRLDQLSGLGR